MPNNYRLTYLIFSREVIEQLDRSNKFRGFLQGIQPTNFDILHLINPKSYRSKCHQVPYNNKITEKSF